MSVITVRNLPAETHRALKVRAAQHGRSTEAEIREILENAVRPKTRVGMPVAEAELVWASTWRPNAATEAAAAAPCTN